MMWMPGAVHMQGWPDRIGVSR